METCVRGGRKEGLFDYLVSKGQQYQRDIEADSFGGLEIERELIQPTILSSSTRAERYAVMTGPFDEQRSFG